ncbi:MAG: tRNA (N(6)-L-threonylcarbamoyladenosine(37)-C(2))-methylthiotransferase MtaB, partial [Flavobacteriaceae bacterium]|nr:tRNA (N(6)-L-threonylcarbamoyladenosine(37)-C(2))-methylthiotransferase MtaB [Flavobacteriaceae bacterium]
EIASKDVKEIILTGVNIGDYGKGEFGNKRHEITFLELIKELDLTKNINRFRISSIEPNLLNNEIIEFVSQSQKIMPHFHIPLQSGSDKILKLMKRRYLSELYLDRVNKIKELMPDCCIGADVIVGFPGENDIDFKRTYDFISSLEISYLHVFSYSERENTESVYFAEKNSKKIKSERSSTLRELSDIKRESFYKKNINSERKILFESENKNGFIHGYTDNYIRVKTIWSSKLVDSIVKRKLSVLSNDNLVVV